MGCGSMHFTISLLLVAATWQRWASFAHIATVRMLSTAAATMASTPCPCTLLRSAYSRSRCLHIRCMGLIKKLWNCSLECGAAAATGPSDAGRLVPGLCCTMPELGVVNMAASESCGGSGMWSHGGGMGLAGRLWGVRSAPLGAGTWMGPRAHHVRCMKGSQTRWVAG